MDAESVPQWTLLELFLTTLVSSGVATLFLKLVSALVVEGKKDKLQRGREATARRSPVLDDIEDLLNRVERDNRSLKNMVEFYQENDLQLDRDSTTFDDLGPSISALRLKARSRRSYLSNEFLDGVDQLRQPFGPVELYDWATAWKTLEANEPLIAQLFDEIRRLRHE